MRKKWIVVAAVAVLAGGAYVALRPHSGAKPAANPAAAQVVVRKASVATAPVKLGPIRTVLTTHGIIEPLLEVDVAAQAPGKVMQVLFKEGETVKVGQPLIRLDERAIRAQLDAARATSDRDRTALERSMRLAQRGIKSSAAVDDSRTTLATSQANERSRTVDLSLMTITAPFAGTVGPAKVEMGSFVTAGQKVVHLVDRSRLRVSFRVAEKLLPQLRVGLPIEASAESLGDTVLKGAVTLLDPTVEPDSRSVLLRAEFEPVKGDVTPGLFVRVGVILRERPQVMLIPRQALMASLSGNYVYRVEDGKAKRVKVTIGEREGDWLEVTDGLAPADQVVAVGQFKLEDGMAVETTPFSPKQ
ncbi:MAG TPA: efflux RND transporter periplasmic adaptor subunit [Magnetospirillum sp.]|nr:efflux RND transporter periplasmic adaptor subunit [Magnetospirillum sp.]